MSVTQLADVIIPDEFTAYQVENSLLSTALYQNGVVANNAEIAAQLQATTCVAPFFTRSKASSMKRVLHSMSPANNTRR